jgi:hypothetical protein
LPQLSQVASDASIDDYVFGDAQGRKRNTAAAAAVAAAAAAAGVGNSCCAKVLGDNVVKVVSRGGIALLGLRRHGSHSYNLIGEGYAVSRADKAGYSL